MQQSGPGRGWNDIEQLNEDDPSVWGDMGWLSRLDCMSWRHVVCYSDQARETPSYKKHLSFFS